MAIIIGLFSILLTALASPVAFIVGVILLLLIFYFNTPKVPGEWLKVAG